MSQKNDSENDIWEYKPLEKKKKRPKSPPATVTKRKCTTRRASKQKTETPLSANSQDSHAQVTDNGVGATNGNAEGACSLQAHGSPSDSSGINRSSHAAEGSSSGDFCPICQMPFSILVVQSQRWHVSECLDVPRDQCKECPDGLQCSSTIPNHYKKFNHTLLAHSRADGDASALSLSKRGGGTGGESSLRDSEADGPASETALSQSGSADDRQAATPQSKRPNGLLFLRSPGPEDFKKKKGWSSSSQSQKSVSSSQESKKELSSTPVKEDGGGQTCERSPKAEYFPEYDDAISFSPLSELPAATEVNKTECRKALFDNGAFENEGENSMTLFSDSFSSEDELYAEFIDNSLAETPTLRKEPSTSNTQLRSVSSLAPINQAAASTVSVSRADSSGRKETPGKSNEISRTSLQSPQSLVLERLRETLQSSNFLPSINSSVQAEQPCTTIQVPSSQNSVLPKSQSMPPHKGKAGQAAGLRQTDIGVFFGLKPLKAEEEAEKAPSEPNASAAPAAGENQGRKRQRRERQRKPRGDSAPDASQAADAVNDGDAVGVRGAARGGGSRGWRRGRWNRTNADGEVELPRCPFYKKIPGTKFTVDAFRYGAIEGISSYFLTHFHSDHYGGLTKNSTLPIYCNRITGNLVKSKLKVAEQYVHILPMNTEVTVEGVRVVLLDANHCPGAAMLLFFLPDGQTVLHTGDFRADPSMETYPELLSCRVQTLYLDTTYCSPEYTFPKQQDVINFAANTAFELVTLNPRTLVVCGSYSVGKEKVFLALAEVLGSKVCLSRDKFNTMCCLESEQIRARVTTDWKAAQVHVLPMMQLTFHKLQDHLARFSRQYDRLVAFKPTGWTFSQQVESVEDIQPQISGNVSIYGIPYSEHSSFLEMKRFVQWLQPLKIIPTVNVGSWASRKEMEKCFSEWLAQAKAKR